MKKILSIIGFAIIAITFASSCASNKMLTLGNWADISSQTEINVMPMPDDISIALILSENHSKTTSNSFIDSVESIVFYAIENERIIDSMLFVPKKVKTQYSSDSEPKFQYNISQHYRFELSKAQTLKDVSFRVELNSKSKKYTKVIHPDYSIYDKLANNEALKLQPSFTILSDGIIEFAIQATRQKIVDEYLPDSEKMRVIVSNSGGKILYNSDNNMSYFQAIQTVLPENIGETYTYRYPWNGMDNNKKKILAGNYKATLMIPAKPTPYVTIINFEWK